MGLTLVDSSVWIDLLADRRSPQTSRLTDLLDEGGPLGIGDLMLIEVLQGARHDRQFDEAFRFLTAFDPIVICDHRIAGQAARHYRHLRALGITIRKTIDTLIATRCIVDDIPLLYSDRDFDPFVEHLGLRSAMGADAKR